MGIRKIERCCNRKRRSRERLKFAFYEFYDPESISVFVTKSRFSNSASVWFLVKPSAVDASSFINSTDTYGPIVSSPCTSPLINISGQSLWPLFT